VGLLLELLPCNWLLLRGEGLIVRQQWRRLRLEDELAEVCELAWC
jgi:hypothetical protein